MLVTTASTTIVSSDLTNMNSVLIVLVAVAACVIAAPAPQLVAAPVVAAPGVVTATSSQYIARNYNGIVPAPAVAVADPYTYSAAFVAAPAVEPVYYI